MESAQQASVDAKKVAEAEVAKAWNESEAKSKVFAQRITLLEKTIKQYENEYN